MRIQRVAISVLLASSVLTGCWSRHRGPHPALVDACVLTTCVGSTCYLGARPYEAVRTGEYAGNAFSGPVGHDHSNHCGCRTRWFDGYRAYYYDGHWEYYDGRQWRTAPDDRRW